MSLVVFMVTRTGVYAFLVCHLWTKYNVTALFFQALVTKLLTFEIVDRTNVICILARRKQSKYEFVYKDSFASEGFEFRRLEIVMAVRKAQHMVKDIQQLSSLRYESSTT